MKKFILSLIAAIAFTASIQAENFTHEVSFSPADNLTHEVCFEADPFLKSLYIKGFYGTNFTNNNMHRSGYKRLGYAISGAVGYTFQPNLSVEAEYAFRSNYKISKHDSSYCSRAIYYNRVSSFMVNVIKDFDIEVANCYKIKPFVGLGLGTDYKLFCGNYLSWQAIAGLKTPISCNMDLSLEYRFHQGVTSNHRVNHTVGLGLAYKL